MSQPVDPRRQLPSVERLAGDPRLRDLGIRSDLLRNAIRVRLGDERSAIADGTAGGQDVVERIIADLRQALAEVAPTVVNATGVLIQTNLGRVPVSLATAEAMATAAGSSVALEVDPATGRRGDRQERVGGLLRALTSCEAALVVNNNAAAVLLTVATLSGGREVVVSRGEAVEIGGGFRIPDVLRQGGATLVEVGTTNRTYAEDYRDAITGQTGILLKVQPSNFVISGYTHAASVRELACVGQEHGLPVVEDQGSGLLNPIALAGVTLGRSLSECLGEGADVVTASADKLLGGPQAGLILGRADLVRRIARHPLARAMRVDKVTLAGVEATLRHYLRGEELTEVPLWRMAGASLSTLEGRAAGMARSLSGEPFAGRLSVVASEATFGGGTLPGQVLPSVAIRLSTVSSDEAGALARRLRLGRTSVWGRIEDGSVLLDLRAVPPGDDGLITEAIRAALAPI